MARCGVLNTFYSLSISGDFVLQLAYGKWEINVCVVHILHCTSSFITYASTTRNIFFDYLSKTNGISSRKGQKVDTLTKITNDSHVDWGAGIGRIFPSKSKSYIGPFWVISGRIRLSQMSASRIAQATISSCPQRSFQRVEWKALSFWPHPSDAHVRKVKSVFHLVRFFCPKVNSTRENYRKVSFNPWKCHQLEFIQPFSRQRGFCGLFRFSVYVRYSFNSPKLLISIYFPQFFFTRCSRKVNIWLIFVLSVGFSLSTSNFISLSLFASLFISKYFSK